MAWYNASWSYRFKITTDQTKVDEAIDNVFYNLANAPAAFWTHVKSDGGDIRVTQTNGTTEVAREISGFVVGSTVGSLFFAATGLSAVADTDYYVYYGNAGASEPADGASYGKQNVWASYLAVFHLDDAGATALNSKNTALNGTGTGETFAVTGKLRTGIQQDAAADEVTAGNHFGVTSAALSLSAWINPDSVADDNHYIVTKIDPGPELGGYEFYTNNGTDRLVLKIADGSTADAPASDDSCISAAAMQHVAVAYDGANANFYVNGVAVGSPASTIVPTDSGNTFTIGNLSDSNYKNFRGVIDEVRVSTSVRSANWWSTEVNNQNSPSTFWTTAAEETSGPITLTPAAVTATWTVPAVPLNGLTNVLSPFVEITDLNGTSAVVGIHTAYHAAAAGSEAGGFSWSGASAYAALTVAYKGTPATTQTLTLPFVP